MLDLSKYGDSEQGPLLSSGGKSGSIILDDTTPVPQTMLLGRNGISNGGLIDDGGLVVVPRRQVQPQSLLLNNILRPQVLDVSPQARALTEDKVR